MFRPALAAMSAFVLVTACSGPASVKQAREGVDAFHANFNSGNNQAIWDTTSFDIRNDASQEQFFGLLNNLRNHYGKVVATEQRGWHYNSNNGDSFSRLDMKTTFEKGAAYERFTYRNVGEGKQLLAGYNISKDPPPKDNESGSASASESEDSKESK
ncbi:MAG: hypothetical protein AB7F98_09755 [Novosphingobium sp.]